MSSPLVDLLGENVQNKSKDEVAVSSLLGEGKILGLYFSAHWCGPCRAFTPNLVKFYESFKETNTGDEELEIVFVSSDRDEVAFEEYYKEMPWLSLNFSSRELKVR